MKFFLSLLVLFFISVLIFKQVDNPLEEKKPTQIYFNNYSETIQTTFKAKNHFQFTDTIKDTSQQSNLYNEIPDNISPTYNMPIFKPDSLMHSFEKLPYENLQSEYEHEPVFFIVDTMPEFPGGVKALEKFIDEHIKYPSEAHDNEIDRVVYVTFIIDKYGKVLDPKIAKGATPELDKEAIRVIQSLPKWKPGKQKGIEVNVSFTLPVRFNF